MHYSCLQRGRVALGTVPPPLTLHRAFCSPAIITALCHSVNPRLDLKHGTHPGVVRRRRTTPHTYSGSQSVSDLLPPRRRTTWSWESRPDFQLRRAGGQPPQDDPHRARDPSQTITMCTEAEEGGKRWLDTEILGHTVLKRNLLRTLSVALSEWRGVILKSPTLLRRVLP